MALPAVPPPVSMPGVIVAPGHYEDLLLTPPTEAKDREPAPVRRAIGS
jgi:hypothetical protein